MLPYPLFFGSDICNLITAGCNLKTSSESLTTSGSVSQWCPRFHIFCSIGSLFFLPFIRINAIYFLFITRIRQQCHEVCLFPHLSLQQFAYIFFSLLQMLRLLAQGDQFCPGIKSQFYLIFHFISQIQVCFQSQFTYSSQYFQEQQYSLTVVSSSPVEILLFIPTIQFQLVIFVIWILTKKQHYLYLGQKFSILSSIHPNIQYALLPPSIWFVHPPVEFGISQTHPYIFISPLHCLSVIIAIDRYPWLTPQFSGLCPSCHSQMLPPAPPTFSSTHCSLSQADSNHYNSILLMSSHHYRVRVLNCPS